MIHRYEDSLVNEGRIVEVSYILSFRMLKWQILLPIKHIK